MHRNHFQSQLPGDPMNCIIKPINGIGALYIGNIESASNGRLLGQYEIGAILSVMSTKDYQYGPHIAHKFVRADDAEFVNLGKHFDESLDFLEEQLSRTNVLVHCHAGISRSATLVLAYLMRNKKMPLNHALQMVQRERRIVNPNPGFIRQLQQYEAHLASVTPPQSRAVEPPRRSSSYMQRQNPTNQMRQSAYLEKSYDNRYHQPLMHYQSAQDLMRSSRVYDRIPQAPQRLHQNYTNPYTSPYARNYSIPYNSSPLNYAQYRQPIY